MVWVSFSASGPGVLHFIGGIMDQHTYLNILKECFDENFYFYRDNDPKRKGYNVWSWLLYNCPHVTNTPAQSPDINPIENLCSYLDRKIRNHTISSKDDLKRALQDMHTKY